ncbi:hypothetical protein P3B99_008270 [Opitutia bacterium KCR 482]|nr:hypothetical protein [Opitutae bacterium KCR 482]
MKSLVLATMLGVAALFVAACNCPSKCAQANPSCATVCKCNPCTCNPCVCKDKCVCNPCPAAAKCPAKAQACANAKAECAKSTCPAK